LFVCFVFYWGGGGGWEGERKSVRVCVSCVYVCASVSLSVYV
jgi:hypothetical protein